MSKRFCGLYREGNFHGIVVKHVFQKKFKSSFLRLLGFVYWHIVSFFIGLFEKNVDIILSPSPPLTIGIINIWLGKFKKSKIVYNVQEIHPGSLITERSLFSSLIIKILKMIASYVYNKSDMVITIDQIFAETIMHDFKDKSKLKIIPNFVNTNLYKPLSKNEINIDRELFPQNDSLKLLYAGNIGRAQDWNSLIEVAKELEDFEIDFFIIGEGCMKDFLQEEISKNRLKKLHVLPYQPREKMPELIAYSDIQFIFMTSPMDEDGLPSKIYTIMACERPLLVCASSNTPIINFLQDKNCAFLVTEKDLNHKIKLIKKFILTIDKKTLKQMGQNGLKEIKSKYSKSIVTKQYIDLINSLFYLS
jgi:glycosyltransferase involved in cell wall biosynthesis